MKYRKGYKYQVAEDCSFLTSIHYSTDIKTEFIYLFYSGRLHIKSGYAWDGASGPTIDTKSSMRGSLVHDALYQLMRQGLLPISFRKAADEELYKYCVEDGMWKWRARIWYNSVEKYASTAADPTHKKIVYEVPTWKTK